jgi:hypothetical protein
LEPRQCAQSGPSIHRRQAVARDADAHARHAVDNADSIHDMQGFNSCFAALRPVSALTRLCLKSLEPLVLTIATKSLQRRNLAHRTASNGNRPERLDRRIVGGQRTDGLGVAAARNQPIVVRQRPLAVAGTPAFELSAPCAVQAAEAERQRYELGTA